MADLDQGPYDAVVVGSGFGGAVTAERLSREGWSVLVLERGKPFPPGTFARTPRGMSHQFWDPGSGRYGMFDLWSFSDVNAVTASGLGGGSLIYANVMVRKPEESFVHDDGEDWPVTRADLEPHYDHFEAIQRPERYPLDHEPYASTPKTLALQQAAGDLGLHFELPQLAVRFASTDAGPPRPGEPLDAPNLHGVPRQTCRLCGECDIGCNYGSKQTLDLTALTAAQQHGAEIRCLCEVTDVAPDPDVPGGWLVSYVQHTAARDALDPALLDAPGNEGGRIRARHVVLAAGAIGTTHLVLRNRANLPGLSAMAGQRFSTNGDLLTFARACRRQDGAARHLDMSRGPVITGRAWVDDAEAASGRGFSIEDAGCPAIAEWMLQAFEVPGDLWNLRHTAFRRIVERLAGRRDTNISAEVAEAFGTAHASADVLALLSMGRDVAGGRFRLDGDELDLDWREDDSAAFFAEMRARCRDVAEAIGGEFMESPWTHLVTVHSLGGMPMGATDLDGAVDPFGNVFGHPGLHVADGAAMPGPVGPNPSFTIAALADRFAEHMLETGP